MNNAFLNGICLLKFLQQPSKPEPTNQVTWHSEILRVQILHSNTWPSAAWMDIAEFFLCEYLRSGNIVCNGGRVAALLTFHPLAEELLVASNPTWYHNEENRELDTLCTTEH